MAHCASSKFCLERVAITGCSCQIKMFIRVGEQFDAPNMLPSAVCLVPLARTVRFLLPSHAKQERDSLILQRSLLATWSASGRQLRLLCFFLCSGHSVTTHQCRAHTTVHCQCILTSDDSVNNLSSPHVLHYVEREQIQW